MSTYTEGAEDPFWDMESTPQPLAMSMDLAPLAHCCIPVSSAVRSLVLTISSSWIKKNHSSSLIPIPLHWIHQ